jgi:hypothetical protein
MERPIRTWQARSWFFISVRGTRFWAIGRLTLPYTRGNICPSLGHNLRATPESAYKKGSMVAFGSRRERDNRYNPDAFVQDHGLTERSSAMPLETKSLVRAIGRWSLSALMLNTIIGASIFGLPSLLAAQLGKFSPAGYLVTAVGIAAIAACLAEVGEALALEVDDVRLNAEASELEASPRVLAMQINCFRFAVTRQERVTLAWFKRFIEPFRQLSCGNGACFFKRLIVS